MNGLTPEQQSFVIVRAIALERERGMRKAEAIVEAVNEITAAKAAEGSEHGNQIRNSSQVAGMVVL